jgi:chromosome segregation ATPase
MTHSPLDWLAGLLDRRERRALARAREALAALTAREHALARVEQALAAVRGRKRDLADRLALAHDARRLQLARNRLALVSDQEQALAAERHEANAALARARRDFLEAERAYRALRRKADRTEAERARARAQAEARAEREAEELFAEATARPRGKPA